MGEREREREGERERGRVGEQKGKQSMEKGSKMLHIGKISYQSQLGEFCSFRYNSTYRFAFH